MRFIALRELKISPSKVIAQLRRGPVVVTRNGKPAAALLRLDEDLLDHFILLHHSKLLEEVKAARSEYFSTGGVSHSAIRHRLHRRRRR